MQLDFKPLVQRPFWKVFCLLGRCFAFVSKSIYIQFGRFCRERAFIHIENYNEIVIIFVLAFVVFVKGEILNELP